MRDVIGWAVVHALWEDAILAVFTAGVLSLVPYRFARLRHAIACVVLALMVIAPLVTAATALDPIGRPVRRTMSETIDGAIGLSTVVSWRRGVVIGAAWFWAAGAAVWLMRIVIERRRTSSFLRRATPASLDVDRRVAQMAAHLNVTRSVQVLCADIAVPLVAGWRRPALVLARDAEDASRSDDWSAIVAHELAHIRRHDTLINGLQLVAEGVLFFHPAARWMAARARVEREYCCDDIASAWTGDPIRYSRALAALEESRQPVRLAVAAASGSLLDRIQRLTGLRRRVVTARGTALAGLASLVAAVIFALSFVVPPIIPLDAKLRARTPYRPSIGEPHSSVPR